MAAATPHTEEYLSADRGPAALGVMVSLTALSTVFVAARLFVRIKLLKNVGFDDYLITASMICGLTYIALSSLAIANGSGRHFDALTLAEKSNTIKWTAAAFCPGIFSFGLPKIGVVALLTKLTEPSRAHRIFLWIASCLTMLLLFGCVIILYAQCRPARSQWDFSVPGECWSPWVLVNYSTVAGAVSAVMDFYLAVYPGLVLAKLQMRLPKKLALMGALSIGMVGTVVAAYKCTRLKGLASPDFSWNTSELVVWTCVEGSTIIIAACIPLMQPILRLIQGRAASSSYRNRYSARIEDDDRNYGQGTHGIPLSSGLSKHTDGGDKTPTDSRSDTVALRSDGAEIEGAGEPGQGWRRHRAVSKHDGAIQRVDEIRVSFEELEREVAGTGGPAASAQSRRWRW